MLFLSSSFIFIIIYVLMLIILLFIYIYFVIIYLICLASNLSITICQSINQYTIAADPWSGIDLV